MFAKLTSNRCDVYYVLLPFKKIKPVMFFYQGHLEILRRGRKKNKLAAYLCTDMNQSSKSAYCLLSRIRPSCSKDRPSDGAEEVCVTVHLCVWWIPGRNAVAFDRFNHFLLYL